MMTFKQFAGKLETIPASTSWYLADLGEARGRQELYTRQAPQKLKILREHALIESAVSSNRIEGITVEQRRIKAVVLGKELRHDCNEKEVRGYPSRSRTEMRPRQQGHGAHGTAELAKSGKSGMSWARPRSFMANQKRVIP